MNILLVEDDQLIAQNISNALSYMGYDVLGPYDRGAEAQQALEQETPDLSILDMDLLDDVSGYEVAKTIRKKHSSPIIFVTGLLDDSTRLKAKEVGAFAFLNKPFHERNLFNAIDLAISQTSSYEKTQAQVQKPVNDAYKIKDKVYLKKQDRYEMLRISDILYMEASGHYVVVQTAERQVLASNHLTGLLDQIQHPGLVRVHRSFAVNIENIPDFDEAFVYFHQKSVPISRAYKAVFRDRLNLI